MPTALLIPCARDLGSSQNRIRRYISIDRWDFLTVLHKLIKNHGQGGLEPSEAEPSCSSSIEATLGQLEGPFAC